MKKLKKTLLAFIVMMGFANLAMAQTNTQDGFYMTPTVEVIFINKEFATITSRVGVGGGVAFGYQFNSLRRNDASNLQIEFSANYQYHDSQSSMVQNITPRGRAIFSQLTGPPLGGLVPEEDFINATATTEVRGSEHFIPITIGVQLNHVIPLAGSRSFSISQGIAGGLWIHAINKTSTRVIDFALANEFPDLNPFITTTTADRTNEVRAVIVPSFALGYSPVPDLTFSLTGKIYIVPNGYSDNYSATARAAANANAERFAPSDNRVDEHFWYGGLNFSSSYIF